MSLDRLWAGWRRAYVEAAASSGEVLGDSTQGGCVFCHLLASLEPAESTHVVWRDSQSAVVLNAYPYTSGHLLAMPVRHVADLDDLTTEEAAGLWTALTTAVSAIRGAYQPDGINLGANLGSAAGAGIPGHLHLHCLPRWTADTNFMTSVAETRVLPEALGTTLAKVTAAWPASSPPGKS